MILIGKAIYIAGEEAPGGNTVTKRSCDRFNHAANQQHYYNEPESRRHSTDCRQSMVSAKYKNGVAFGSKVNFIVSGALTMSSPICFELL